MPLQMSLWRVSGNELRALPTSELDAEQRLEDWIARDPSILGLDLLIVGRQVATPHGGRIDLLAIDENANTVILELKRGRTPRDIVAQVLDYASWVRTLTYGDLSRIAAAWAGSDLRAAYEARFGVSLPDTVNADHRMVVVASELDDSTERIIDYLAEEHDLDINAVFFNSFRDGDAEFLGRAWLSDPDQVAERRIATKHAPWTGYWFVNVGHGPHRTWDDGQRYGFISAGGGPRYSQPIRRLRPGDRIFAYMTGRGYVGYGEVTREAVPVREFFVESEGAPLLDLPLAAANPTGNGETPDLCDWVAGVRWRKTFGEQEAQTFKGVFANQNVACKLRHAATLEFLRDRFGLAEEGAVAAQE